MNREFLLLAKNLDDHQPVSNLYASIKLDGQRCLWDGGVTRGMLKEDVPWANILKDDRYKERQVSTGLWSRYGNVIHAPGWFLDALPPMVLDGELYLGRGMFQECRSIISKIEPDSEAWKRVRYHVFDSPALPMLFQTGRINNPNFDKYIEEERCLKLFNGSLHRVLPFNHVVQVVFDTWLGTKSPIWQPVTQTQLPRREDAAKEKLQTMLEAESLIGGEGIMLRDPHSVWHPKRAGCLLKVKKLTDDVAEVIGFTAGLGKLEGLIGSVHVEWKGQRFELSGFTDAERAFDSVMASDWARRHPGQYCPVEIDGASIKKGLKIRFLYRVLTDKGIPREARYMR